MLNRVMSASLRLPVAYEVTLLQKAARDLNWVYWFRSGFATVQQEETCVCCAGRSS